MLPKRHNYAWLCCLSLTIFIVTYRTLNVSKLYNPLRDASTIESNVLAVVDEWVSIKDRFHQQWLQHEADRKEWFGLLKSCKEQTEWKDALPWWQREERTDPDLTFITQWNIKPAGEFSSLVLQTQYKNGTIKQIGGDGWRIKVTGIASLQAFTRDLENGTYEVTFLPLENGPYSIEIHLEYTLCDAMKNPPMDWFIRGNIQGKEQPHGLLNSDMPYINKPLWKGSPIQFNVPPSRIISAEDRQSMKTEACSSCNSVSTTCKMIGNGFGQWRNESWEPYCQQGYRNASRRSKQRRLLWVFGDSVSAAFYRSIKTRPLCTQVFNSCFYSYNWVYQLENYNHTTRSYIRRPSKIEKSLNDSLDFKATRVVNELNEVLQHPQMDETSAVLLNYGLHYVESIRFEQFKKLITDLIKFLKNTNYKGTVIWRTTTSMSREKYSVPYLHSRRFLNSQRVELYNRYALALFCSAGIEILDVFPLTVSYPFGTGSPSSPYDPVHYESHVLLSIEKLLIDRFHFERKRKTDCV